MGWIPVEDRMPPPCLACLIFDGSVTMAFWVADLGWTALVARRLGVVTHWMPLPGPPMPPEPRT